MVHLSVQGQAGCASWGALQSRARPGAPVALEPGRPQQRKVGRPALLALRRGWVESRVRTSLLFQFDMVFGFFFVLFLLGEGLKG